MGCSNHSYAEARANVGTNHRIGFVPAFRQQFGQTLNELIGFTTKLTISRDGNRRKMTAMLLASPETFPFFTCLVFGQDLGWRSVAIGPGISVNDTEINHTVGGTFPESTEQEITTEILTVSIGIGGGI